MARKRRAVLVLGMHRSGTSALTRVLNLMGLALPSQIMPAVPDNNETGFWESAEIAAIHDRLLDEVKSSWDDCLRFPASFLGSTTARSFADEILRTLENDFGDTDQFVIKDPRICRFLPFWLDVLAQFDADPHVVLISRSPFEVAASLARRDGFHEAKSLHLWLRHVLDMERDSRGVKRSLVVYSALLEDWRRIIRQIARDRKVQWPRTVEEAGDQVDAFLSDALRHHRIEDTEDATGPELYRWVEEAHRTYVQTAESGRSLKRTFDRITRQLEAAEEIFAPSMAAVQDSLWEGYKEFDRRTTEMTRAWDKDKSIYETEIKKNLSALQEYDSNILEQQRLLDKFAVEREASTKAAIEAQANYEAEITKLRSVLEVSDSKVYKQQEILEDLIGKHEELKLHRNQILKNGERLEKEIEVLRSERDQILNNGERLEKEIEVLRSERDQAVERQESERLQGATLQEALEANRKDHAKEVQALRADLDRVRSHRESLDKDLAAARATVGDLQTQLQSSEARAQRHRARSDELERDLLETRGDKDWLWERWHETKDELAALRTSNLGKLIWWQWTTYLSIRHKLVRMRGRLTRPISAPTPSSGGGSRGTLGRIGASVGRGLKAFIRQITAGLGWIYLLLNLILEQIRAAVRNNLRRADDNQPLAAPKAPRSRLPRVLLVSPYPIYPPHHGGGVRLYNLIQRLADHCELHLLVFSGSGEDPEQREALSSWTRSVHFHHWHPGFDPGWWHLQPPNAGLFYSDEVARQVAHLLSTQRIDILQLEYTELGQYGLPRFANIKVVLTEHDLAFQQHRRRRRMGFHDRFPEGNAYGSTFGDWLRVVRYELAVCRRADQIHVMSENDGQVLSRYLGDAWERIRIVPNAVDTAFYDSSGEKKARNNVLYVGNFQNLPNVDALEYLVDEIWPLVRSQHPEVGLTVVGAHPSDRVTRYHGRDGIDVVGGVPDLRPYYHCHRLMVAPIRAGSGTRLKILEAFAAGLPVVSTKVGAEGIDAVHGKNVLLADDSQDFAQSVVDLLQDQDQRQRLSENGRSLAVEAYDWQRSADATLDGWHELLMDGENRGQSASEPISPAAATDTRERSVDVSVVIPTFHGGKKLAECLTAIANQTTGLSYEIICVDSGSNESDLTTIHQHDARLVSIDPADFDHGLTRDLGAAHSRGQILVFLNQDAIPSDDLWLTRLTEPLLEDEHCAAVQGRIQEMADAKDRFFWDSGGERFYFTRESERWNSRYYGIGFSTVNAAIRHRVWEQYPFGRAPIMEDKKWQKEVVENGFSIQVELQAAVIHTHNYQMRSLWRRCLSEGFGWRLVGERYSLLDMIRDGLQFRVHMELAKGLAQGRVRSAAEILFPWLRPLALYWGNHWSRSVKL